MATHTFPAVTDHSWARPSPMDIINAGYTGVGRYLGYDTNGRDISKQELQSYLDVGLQVFFIVQGGKSTVLGGYDQGVKHADMANDRLHDLGVPTNVRIVSTVVDYDAPDSDIRNRIPSYTHGFQMRSNYDHIPYGKDRVLDILCGELQLFDCGWQTRAWSGGRVSKYACMMQEVGYVLNDTSDHNSIYVMGDVEKLLHPLTTTPEEEEEMADSRRLYFTNTKDSKWVSEVFGAEPGSQHVFRHNLVTRDVRHCGPAELEKAILWKNDPTIVWQGGVPGVAGELDDSYIDGMTLIPHNKY